MLAGVIIASKVDDALKIMERYPLQLYEIRVDAMEELSNFQQLERYREKLIITVRRRQEGGLREIGERERLRIFEEFLEIEPRYMDVEFHAPIRDELLKLAKRKDVDVILSYHNFQGTPSIEELIKLAEKMRGGAVRKIVPFARSYEDNLRLLRLYEHSDGDIIAFCMGEMGKISRVLSSFFAPFTYVSLSDATAAQGILTLDEMRRILEVLGNG